jgi:vacuolar-type H+-ATPase subunit H
MIDVMDIMKQIEHMETNSPEQMQERYKEACRLIKEREDESMRIIEENHKAFMKNHETFMENHDARMMELRLLMQEELSRTPKRQIYFGKVKTE